MDMLPILVNHFLIWVFDKQVFTFLSGIFEDDFIEERRQGLEAFVNRY